MSETRAGAATDTGATRSPWGDRVAAELDAIRSAGRWRQPRDLATSGAMTGSVATGTGTGTGTGAGTGAAAGRDVVSFASNDYLGLTHHAAVAAAAHAALDRWGTGTGASRLVVGSRPLHAELEAELADWKGTDDAVLFPTGYAANLGLLSTLGGPDVTILSDELNHASIVDGSRLARATVRIFRHGDVDHLRDLLADVSGAALVVTDSAFSMDGDVADLPALLDLCAASGALLVLDEAHAVLGPELPAGTPGTADVPVLRMGTLSKALGSLGGFVAGPRPFVDLLRNRARTFIFTTAPTPADTAAALAALRVVRSAEGAALVARLRRHVDRLRPGHPTPIVPVVLGDEAAALAGAERLLERGLLVPAIRPPTVPVGTSRLRVALSAAHTDDQVDRLVAALAELPAAELPAAELPGAAGSGAGGPDAGGAIADAGNGTLVGTGTGTETAGGEHAP